jgi:hypothetical protein
MMRVPKEILNIIVSYLPISKIFELWCTGRELHDMKYFRDLYNYKILPYLNLVTLIKFEKFAYEQNKGFYICFKDDWLLKTFGILNGNFEIYNHITTLSLKMFSKDIKFNVSKNKKKIFWVLIDKCEMCIYWENDNLSHHDDNFRFDVFNINRIEYSSYWFYPLVIFHIKKNLS